MSKGKPDLDKAMRDAYNTARALVLSYERQMGMTPEPAILNKKERRLIGLLRANHIDPDKLCACLSKPGN